MTTTQKQNGSTTKGRDNVKAMHLGVQRDTSRLYWIDRDGWLVSKPRSIGNVKSSEQPRREPVQTHQLKKEEGWLYFLDRDGDISGCILQVGSKPGQGAGRRRKPRTAAGSSNPLQQGQ